MQAKDLKAGDKFKVIGEGVWSRDLEVLEVSVETVGKWNPVTRIVIKIIDGKIKLRPNQEVILI
jgi:hypothetical protein